MTGRRTAPARSPSAIPYCRLINQENKGLSAARNVGAEAATGEIVVYTDSDCVADPDWLNYLVGTMERGGLVACGGPNFPPPENSLVPAAVAVSPGGPTHVLLDDEIAEHIAGCNMAFRREVLLGLGGFDPTFRTAGDDVDMCWRLQDAGYTIGFSPAAMVWHFRRNTVKAYIGQQRGYGKAEALVYEKHPGALQRIWPGDVERPDLWRLVECADARAHPRIYSGVFGRGLFQNLYEKPGSLTQHLPMTFEWGVAAPFIALAGIVAGGWWMLLIGPLLLTWAICVTGAARAKIDPRFNGIKARALVALLIYLGPLLRGYERLKWRLKLMHADGRDEPAGNAPGPRLSWRDRGFALSYWSEQDDEKETLLGELMALARRTDTRRRWIAAGADGICRWLAACGTARASWLPPRTTAGSSASIACAACRCCPDRRGSAPGLFAIAFLALVSGWGVGAAGFALAGAGACAALAVRMVAFTGRLRRLIDAAAGEAQITPLDVVGRPPVATGAPRTA